MYFDNVEEAENSLGCNTYVFRLSFIGLWYEYFVVLLVATDVSDGLAVLFNRVEVSRMTLLLYRVWEG
jgi:hypothetical protein